MHKHPALSGLCISSVTAAFAFLVLSNDAGVFKTKSQSSNTLESTQRLLFEIFFQYLEMLF